MKKTQKKVVGLLGLVLVVVLTVFAALLPAPGTQATTTVQDTITVKVIGEKPKVDIEGIETGNIFTKPTYTAKVVYEDIEYITITLKYTDQNGNTKTTIIRDGDAVDPPYGELPLYFDFGSSDYGYGDYVLEVIGTGYKGAVDTETVKFSYQPVYGEATSDGSDGKVVIDLDYDTGSDGEVEKVVVEVLDENGNVIDAIPAIVVYTPETKIELNLADYGLEPGYYKVKLTAYDADGKIIYEPYVFNIYYKGLSEAGIPDTGQISQNVNISKTDYLITGLIIFGLVAVGGVVFIQKKDRSGRARRK